MFSLFWAVDGVMIKKFENKVEHKHFSKLLFKSFYFPDMIT